MRTLAVALAGAAVFVIACSSNSSPSSASTTSGGGGSQATGSPISISVMGTFSDPALGLPQIPAGVKARVAYQNAHGGLNGHKIVVVACDDQFTPAGAGTCATQAVSAGVVAGVGFYTFQGNAIWPVLSAANIPVIGQLPFNAGDFTNPLSFPTSNALPITFGSSAVSLVKHAKCKSVQIIHNELASSTEAVNATIYALKKLGVKYTGSTIVPTTTTGSLASYAASALQNSSCISDELNVPFQANLLSALHQINPNVVVSASGLGVPLNWPTAYGTASANLLITDDTQPIVGNPSKSSGIAAFQSQMKRYESGVPADGWALRSWLGADSFIKVASTIKGKVTATSVLSAIKGTTSLNTGTVLGPVNFVNHQTLPGITQLFNTSQYWQSAKGGKAVVVSGPVNIYPYVKGFTGTP
jgi:ABC-type branched-subunit amino acid transport system substrate-binding protein